MNLNEVFSSDVIRPLSSDHEVVSEVTTSWKHHVVLLDVHVHMCSSVSNRSALSPNLFTSLAKHVTFVGETTYVVASNTLHVCTVHARVYSAPASSSAVRHKKCVHNL